jgi:RNA polymerase sigma-70 factor, ECF subfamily
LTFDTKSVVCGWAAGVPSAAKVVGVQLFQRDRDVLGVIARGSESAFMGLVDRHQSALTRLASYWLADERAADRVVEQTWHTVLTQLERFDAKAPLKVWLFSVLLKLLQDVTGPEDLSATDEVGPAVDPVRFSPPGDRWDGHWAKPPVPWPESSRIELNVAECTVLDSAIRALPRAQRAVLVLRDMEGLTSEHVGQILAQILAIDAEAQVKLLHAARSQLRARLDLHYEHKSGAR